MIKNGEGKTFFKSARFSFSFSSIFHRNTFGREVRFREVETFLLTVLRISFFLVILNFGELSQRNCLSFVLYQILFCRYNRRLKSMLITHATVWVILIPQWGSSSVEGGFQMEIIFKTFKACKIYHLPTGSRWSLHNIYYVKVQGLIPVEVLKTYKKTLNDTS